MALYSLAFLKAIAFVLPHEEQFARGHWGDENFVVTENVPGDGGGLTKWGIDAKSHPGVDIPNLNRSQAIGIYHDEWKWRNLDALPIKLAIALFDVWVNGGFAVKWLQIALNKIAGANLVVDGDLGAKTLAAAAGCDQNKIVSYFIDERDARFERLAQRPSQQQFREGWEDRDRDLREYLRAA